MPQPLGQSIVWFALSVPVLSWSSAVQAAQPGIDSTREIVVKTESALQQALRGQLRPGTVVQIAPGRYIGYHGLANQAGTAEAPITIAALDPAQPPVFCDSPTAGLQVLSCGYIIFRHLRFENNRDIGLHVATSDESPPAYDALSPSHHITIEDVTILGTGTSDSGNHDALKFYATDHFVVRRVTIRGWGSGGGSAVDIMGSQYGLIEDSNFAFPERPPSGTDTGLTMKGGSRDIVVRRNLFHNAGQNSIEIGQDTGIKWFRNPPGTVLADGTVINYEAKSIQVYGNVVAGSQFPVMFMKSTDSNMHHNTIVMPEQSTEQRGILKISTSSNDGLLNARNATFENNLIVYFYGGLMTWWQPFVSIYPDSKDPSLATFKFANNAWYQLDVSRKGRHLPDSVGNLGLPRAEKDPAYQVDPQLAGLNYATGEVVAEQIRVRSPDRRLRGVGADSYSRSAMPEAAESPAPAVRRPPR